MRLLHLSAWQPFFVISKEGKASFIQAAFHGLKAFSFAFLVVLPERFPLVLHAMICKFLIDLEDSQELSIVPCILQYAYSFAWRQRPVPIGLWQKIKSTLILLFTISLDFLERLGSIGIEAKTCPLLN